MTIYEREGGFNIGPFSFGGKLGEIVEPYTKTIAEKRDGPVGKLLQLLGAHEYKMSMDVCEDEIAVWTFWVFGEPPLRIIAGPEINKDQLTRKYFIFKP